METKKLTAAESTLAAMSKTVLVLGIIGSIVVLFSSCIMWEYSKYSGGIIGLAGINWLSYLKAVDEDSFKNVDENDIFKTFK